MMKRFFAFVLVMMSIVIVQAQVVSSLMMNTVYRGIPTPISVATFNYPCSVIILKADTGTLKKNDGECGKYIYDAPRNGDYVTFKIYAKTKSGLKLIDTSVFSIRPMPLPDANIGWFRNHISISNLLRAQQMETELNGLNWDTGFHIDSFNYAITRDGQMIVYGKNIGAIFQQNILTSFTKVQEGDTIMFYNIFATHPGDDERKLEPFELYITN